MRIHFIAIGGSAMHNLAIALKEKGYDVSGSDDEIFEPSLSRLKKHGILPTSIGWDTNRITKELDAIVLGMHARLDNPELLKAEELGLRIYSYPEYLYEQTKDKIRIVIGGSHGKTTITSMVMHVLRNAGIDFDYMVGAQLDGFENMVSLKKNTKIAVFEGDEYLTSPIDLRPKFHLYQPNIALISGIAWDHINAFPTYEIYKNQFAIFIDKIAEGDVLIYCNEDSEVAGLAKEKGKNIKLIPYNTHRYESLDGAASLIVSGKKTPLAVFGKHNMQNISGAKAVCNQVGITDEVFYKAISTFKGASRRLQLLAENKNTKVFLDFAHSPSKVAATVQAVRESYTNRELVACLELHTFSSLNAEFLGQYKGTMEKANIPLVYFNPSTIEHKKLQLIEPDLVKDCFGTESIKVFTNAQHLLESLKTIDWQNKNLLIMTSGNFSGVNLQEFAKEVVQ
ncbi:MAG: peptidoglycan synthetase [Bacteroidales bacterium]|nr:MAG: peptidoglycan synthetase [Bacteroidales bacterium]